MIAIGTFVLVRLVTDDDPEQAQLVWAQDALESAARTGTVLVIVNVVLCELIWVLTRSYGDTKLQCIGVFGRLLGFPALSFESRKLVRNTTLAWRGSKADSAAATIGLVAAELGAEFVLSFDKKMPAHWHRIGCCCDRQCSSLPTRDQQPSAQYGLDGAARKLCVAQAKSKT